VKVDLIDFWLERWNKGDIRFHQQTINPYLGYYYGEHGPPPRLRRKLRVFVPLCGKSKDLGWLSVNGFDTVGVECSRLAVEEFFAEQSLEFSLSHVANHISYKAENLEILVGDFFALESKDVGHITDIFDRAALIALPQAMRRQYVTKITGLQTPGTRTLLITLAYPQREMEGPPFSVSENEVYELYGDNYSIEKLAAKNVIEDEPRFKDRGLTSLTETAYKLTRI
jgi:thiopurine S-methyltransferase